jgi:hypothetical protein
MSAFKNKQGSMTRLKIYLFLYYFHSNQNYFQTCLSSCASVALKLKRFQQPTTHTRQYTKTQYKLAYKHTNIKTTLHTRQLSHPPPPKCPGWCPWLPSWAPWGSLFPGLSRRHHASLYNMEAIVA